MANGWRRTVPAVFSPLLSDIPISCIVLLVLTQVPPLLVNLLRLFGGFYLLYLAFGSLQSFRRYRQEEGSPAAPVTRTILKAALVNVLNPNPYLGWALVMGPLLLKAWQEAPSYAVSLLILFYMVMILSTAAILALFAGARSLGPRIARSLVGASAAALFFFGLYQLWAVWAVVTRGTQPPV
jgi:threonine/homoserine/homoserine lactone efflux protein